MTASSLENYVLSSSQIESLVKITGPSIRKKEIMSFAGK
jgi:hypothetical protein